MRAPLRAQSVATWPTSAAPRHGAGIDFWYTPVDPALLGLIRILTGMMLLYNHAIWGVVLNDFFGPDSWLSQDLVADYSRTSIRLLILVFCPCRDGLARLRPLDDGPLLVHDRPLDPHLFDPLARGRDLICHIAFPRPSSGSTRSSRCSRSTWRSARPGRAFSVDSWLARRRAGDQGPAPPPSPPISLFVSFNVHMCIIYLFAGLSKLLGRSLVEWPGDVDGAGKSRIPVDRHDLAGLAPLV